ncbi:unnamed protein product [Prunus brigantina]
MWFGKKPSLGYIKIWGCPAYVKRQDVDKLDARSVKCRFIGYPKETMGYYFYHIDDQKLFVASRVRRMPERYYGFLHENEGELNLLSDCKDIEDPLNYNEAMSDIDSHKWLGAMKSEMDSMYTNKVRTLVDPPLGIVPIGNKWIFKRKIGSDGKVETYKARLVAKGYKRERRN